MKLMNFKSFKLYENYNLKDLPFYNDIIKYGGKIYQVGGAVRDTYTGKVSKDLDILITGIPNDILCNILNPYGKTDMVGASFGIIKFTPIGGEEIDIAIPRTEIKNGIGYKGFDVKSDHTLPIETDLSRRDFTINSIAKDADGNIIDPFNGVSDLKNKIIKLTNPIAFSDDPLRMLRAVQFATRFNFTIESNTFKLIQQNAKNIADISKERILIEFDKIVKKGNPKIGAELLVNSNLYFYIFGKEFNGKYDIFSNVSKMSEFIYWLIEGITKMPDKYFKDVMKGDLITYKEISALSYMFNNIKDDIVNHRWCYFNLNKIAPSILNSFYVLNELNDVIDDFNIKKYPIALNELAINGNDLIQLGIKGKNIGDTLLKILDDIYKELYKNEKYEILNNIKKI